MREVADNQDIVRINPKEVCHHGGIVVRIQTLNVDWAGRASDAFSQKMCRFFRPKFSAMLDQLHRDSQISQEFCDSHDFVPPLVGQATVRIFFG